MSPDRARNTSREEWERIRSAGLASHLWWNGVIARGVPMAIFTVLLLQLFEGEIGWHVLRDPGFHLRLLAALAVFAVGGMIGAYARWRVLEGRFGGPEGEA